MRCGGTITTLANIWSSYGNCIRRPIGICSQCGHVQIAKLFKVEEYATLNNELFAEKYHPITEETRKDDRFKKIQTTLIRLQSVIGDDRGGKLLDIGAGEGWSHEVAQQLGFDYYAVEAQTYLKQHLIIKGANIAANSISELLPKWTLGFRVIILRHTLEHLLDPVGDLSILAKCLSKDGLLYVCVPNFGMAHPKAGFRTDYLRPMHISYFTLNKLEWSLFLAGLRAESIHNESELWGIVRPGISRVELKDERNGNSTQFYRLMRKYLIRDFLKLCKIIGSRLLLIVRG